MAENRKNDVIRQDVRNRYAGIATSGGGCCAGGKCCSPDVPQKPDVSTRLGYSGDDLAAVPKGANMGLGCGNPQAIAALKPGETVLDLGSGGGLDCFLAARQVGETGRVIGVDMTPEMLGKARANADQGGYGNVEFRLGEIEHLPVADSSVDVIISNCVINLSPDKPQVYRDAFRVLRPGGRLAISDVVALRQLPDDVRGNPEAICGCVAGAIPADEVEALLDEIGFVEIAVEVKPASREFIRDWFPGSGLEEYVRSAAITARKAPPSCCCSSSPRSADADGSILDSRTKELIAIGAAVAGHCQPCLTYHVARARELGTAHTGIAAAMDVGRMIEQGAAKAMREFAKGALGSSVERTGCCSDTELKKGKSGCGPSGRR